MKTIDDFIKLGKSRGANFRLGPDHTHLADIFGVGFAWPMIYDGVKHQLQIFNYQIKWFHSQTLINYLD